jgi:hypothetical protein
MTQTDAALLPGIPGEAQPGALFPDAPLGPYPPLISRSPSRRIVNLPSGPNEQW